MSVRSKELNTGWHGNREVASPNRFDSQAESVDFHSESFVHHRRSVQRSDRNNYGCQQEACGDHTKTYQSDVQTKYVGAQSASVSSSQSGEEQSEKKNTKSFACNEPRELLLSVEDRNSRRSYSVNSAVKCGRQQDVPSAEIPDTHEERANTSQGVNRGAEATSMVSQGLRLPTETRKRAKLGRKRRTKRRPFELEEGMQVTPHMG